MVVPFTGTLLTGPILRSDIILPSKMEVGRPRIDNGRESRKFTMDGLRVVWINVCGYIPGLSIFTGAFRILAGLIHAIAHLTKILFARLDLQKAHLDEALLGFYNVGRGVIEMVPLLGNFFCFSYDRQRVWAVDAPRLIFGAALLAAQGR